MAGRVAARWTRDFGGAERRRPALLARVADSHALERALRRARELRLPVTVRGCGHSCNGQTLSAGGLLMALEPARRSSLALRPDGTFEVWAGERWRGVERRLNRAGRSVPVLPDYLDLSVGGTLAVGGYGADSVRLGSLVDQVERLRLRLPDGSVVWCSEREEPELFRFSLAGLGQFGIIERAVLRSVAYRGYATLFTYRYASLAELVESCAWMVDAPPDSVPELFKALHTPVKSVATYGVCSRTLASAARCAPPAGPVGRRHRDRLILPRYRWMRSLAVSIWVGRFVAHRRVWCDYMLDLQGLRSFAAFLEELLADGGFAGCLESVYIVAIRRGIGRVRLPLEACSGLAGSLVFGIGLYSMVPHRDDAALARVQSDAARCLERAAELGGRPYLYGFHPLREELTGDLYGSDAERVADLRRRLDPEGRFQPAACGLLAS